MNKEQEQKISYASSKIIDRLAIIERVLLGWDSEGNKLSAGSREGSLRLRISQDLGGHDEQIAPYNLSDIKQDLEVLKTHVIGTKQVTFAVVFWSSFFIVAVAIMCFFYFYI